MVRILVPPLLIFVGLGACQPARAQSVPGVADSMGFISSSSTISSPLDNKTGSGGPVRYSFMLEGCCDWDSCNLSAPMLLHTEIATTTDYYELDFTYDKLYDFFGGAASGLITWWWAEQTHGAAYCVKSGDAVGGPLFLDNCIDGNADQVFATSTGGVGPGAFAIIHKASGPCVQASAAARCSGAASSHCEFLEREMTLQVCEDDLPSQLWLAPRRVKGLDDALKNITGIYDD